MELFHRVSCQIFKFLLADRNRVEMQMRNETPRSSDPVGLDGARPWPPTPGDAPRPSDRAFPTPKDAAALIRARFQCKTSAACHAHADLEAPNRPVFKCGVAKRLFEQLAQRPRRRVNLAARFNRASPRATLILLFMAQGGEQTIKGT